jgi:hypothetical protein
LSFGFLFIPLLLIRLLTNALALQLKKITAYYSAESFPILPEATRVFSVARGSLFQGVHDAIYRDNREHSWRAGQERLRNKTLLYSLGMPVRPTIPWVLAGGAARLPMQMTEEASHAVRCFPGIYAHYSYVLRSFSSV